MRSKSPRLNLVALPTIVAFLTAARPGDAGTILPVDQSRSVATENVNAAQCSPEFLFDGEEAARFEPFDAFVQTEQSCDSGFALASASQDSQINASSMTGSGSAASEAHGPVPGIVHAFGISHFVVTFELPSAGNFTLDAMMSAGSFPDANVGAVGLIRLWEGPQGGELILQHSVEPVVGGEINSELVEEAGVLQAGVFTLDVQAGTFMKNPVPPSRSAQASFDFTFGVSVLGDLDGDGTVGIIDFLILLASWGPCPQPCPPSCAADLDGDCTVGITDFLLLLAEWG